MLRATAMSWDDYLRYDLGRLWVFHAHSAGKQGRLALFCRRTPATHLNGMECVNQLDEFMIGMAFVQVKTMDGQEIGTPNIVLATNSPTHHNLAIHSRQHPYRSYCVGLKIAEVCL